MTDLDILNKAIETYGAENQERVAVEECCELCVAIAHKQRGREHNLCEEIADVEIMLEQLKIINKCGLLVDKIKKEKIARLKNRVYWEVLGNGTQRTR